MRRFNSGSTGGRSVLSMQSTISVLRPKATAQKGEQLDTGPGPRAVPGSQQPRRQVDIQVSFGLPVQSDALRAGDGSRSDPCALQKVPKSPDVGLQTSDFRL